MAEPGDRIAAYDIVRLIARRGITTVYEARQPGIDRTVALKQLDLRGADARRFVDKLRDVAQLEHPNIVTVYDCFEADGMAYIAMEYVPIPSLRSFVHQLTPSQMLEVVHQILAGLAHAEVHGVTHGDLRPEKVLMTNVGQIKVADFGIATAYLNELEDVEEPGTLVGTPTYMAPEQAMGKPVGPYTDLYALGVMTYEMLSGRPPFDGDESPMTVLLRHVNERPPALTGVDARLAEWVAWLLEKDPAARPSGARDAWRRLERVVVGSPGPRWREAATLDEIPDDGVERAHEPLPAPAPVPEVVARPVALGPPELARILRRASQSVIVAGDRSVAVQEPPAPPAPEREPPVATVPAASADSAAESPPPPAPRRGGWRSVRLLLLGALAGGIAYAILERILGSTVPSFAPPSAPADEVSCTVFAPPVVAPQEPFLVQAFVHVPGQAEDTRALALEMDTTAARRAFRSLAAPVPRGSRLDFELHAPGLEIDDPVASLVWQGRPEAVQFGVTAGAGVRGTAIATLYVSLNSAPLGHVKFKLTIGSQATVTGALPEPQGEAARRYRAAFISYASKDRDKVLERVQMLPLVGIRYFQDLLDLEPGDRWQRRLELGIDECDLFLLFWSGEAKDSPWVRQEVRHALQRQSGDDLAEPEIKPVIIEGPPVIEPWAELAHLHFNDRVLYFMRR